MKKGYKRLLIFLSVLIIILCLNTFVMNILSNYRLVFFLIVLLIAFDHYFMMEKDNNRFFKDLLFEIFVFIIAFFIVFYMLGLIVGLTKVPNYLTLNGIKNVLLPIILIVSLREVFRYNLLRKADGNLICTIAVVILIMLIDY